METENERDIKERTSKCPIKKPSDVQSKRGRGRRSRARRRDTADVFNSKPLGSLLLSRGDDSRRHENTWNGRRRRRVIERVRSSYGAPREKLEHSVEKAPVHVFSPRTGVSRSTSIRERKQASARNPNCVREGGDAGCRGSYARCYVCVPCNIDGSPLEHSEMAGPARERGP